MANRKVANSTFVLCLFIWFLFGASTMYFWYEPMTVESKAILKDQIAVLEGQRDQLLRDRRNLKSELDELKAAAPGSEAIEAEDDVEIDS